ncbi:MAG: AccI family restriction endonuclease [Anaerolineae bacterium]
MSLFDAQIAAPAEDIGMEFKSYEPISWLDFWLNPRRLRGSDFLMRWSQGVWSEERLVQAVNETDRYYASPYGPSSTAPDDPREFELYFERLEQAGLGKLKRPDLLIFRRLDHVRVTECIRELGGVEELPFITEDAPRMKELLSLAVIAVESENSLWVAEKMPDYGIPLKPQRRLGGQPGLKKSAVAPTIIIKQEDLAPLLSWQELRGVPIHVWHVFFDLAFGIAVDKALRLIRTGQIEETTQVFQAPGGATTRKGIYKIYYHHAYPLGVAEEQPALVADFVEDKNGHILPYVKFVGGRLKMRPEALEVLDEEVHKSPN